VTATARFRIAWSTDVGTLVAEEPRLADVTAHAAVLAAAYNDPQNARLMGHPEPFGEADVVEHYASLLTEGARPFLFYREGKLVGDADLRGMRDGAAEFAFLIAARDQQGRGLGTKLAVMVHAFAFTTLGLERVFVSVAPQNSASRRVFEKLGYVDDDGPEARSFADEPSDLTMVLERATFIEAFAAGLDQLRIEAV
jgi:RimJ/RimL family protein N-acetyltransferase